MKLEIVLFAMLAAHAAAKTIKTKVLILGGGMSGTIAARTLSRANVTDFLIVEARHELGGRMMNAEFVGQTVELGANWVLGTVNNVTNATNPIWDLALQYTHTFGDN